MKNIWLLLKPELIKHGFIIDDKFLENLSIKNNKYIKHQVYNLPLFIHNFLNITKDSKNLIIKKCYPRNVVKKSLIINSYINKGTYNQVYHVIDIQSNKNYAYRFSNLCILDDSNLINNFIETFTHLFLSLYQKKYLLINKSNLYKNKCDCHILQLRHFGYNTNIGLISTLTNKMDGTLYNILSIQNIKLSQKINILANALIQITCIIEHLQKQFKFIHNDLKANNIFYKILDNTKVDLYNPNNLHFFISDFDASRIEICGHIIIGNTHLSPDSTFNSRKDLFILLHSLYYIFNSTEWILGFFEKFNLDLSIKLTQSKFNTLYNCNKDSINKIFEPNKFKKLLFTLI